MRRGKRAAEKTRGDIKEKIERDLGIGFSVIEHYVNRYAIFVVELVVGDVKRLLQGVVVGHKESQRKVFAQLWRHHEAKHKKPGEDEQHAHLENHVAAYPVLVSV